MAEADFGLTLSRGWIPCTVFINGVSLLGAFCEFLNDVYGGSRPYEFDRIVAQYALRRKNGLAGGACDMTAFELFSDERFGEIGEVSLVRDGSVYDPGITVPQTGFQMADGIKRVEWLDGAPQQVHGPAGTARHR